jgi:nucleotide-binding universal stress UspA family protein
MTSKGVVAALDDRAAAWPVLLAARRLAHCLARPVVVLHAEEQPRGRALVEELAERTGVSVDTRTGDATTVLLEVAGDPDVDALVIGVRGVPGARRSLGHVTDRLVRSEPRVPLVLVPPRGVPEDVPLRRVLAPLDTDPRCAAASEAVVQRLRRGGCQVLGLHVFEPATVPAFLDHPGHGADTWGDEFARRHGLDRVELRRGPPASTILATAREQDVDLVVLAWSCVLDEEHGHVVGEVLAGADVPVMLVPTDVYDTAGAGT